MFDILDSDNDGLISSNKTHIEGLNIDLVMIISEMLFEIDDF